MRLAAALTLAAGLLSSGQAANCVDVVSLVARASAWTVSFEKALSGLLFRERLSQGMGTERTAGSIPSPWAGLRTIAPGAGVMDLEANVFLLKPAGSTRFIVFRDVYRVGNRDITDHTARLRELLVADTKDSLEQARELTNASARYNIGQTERNTNVPTMAFEYLKPERLGGLRVREVGRDRIDGLETVVVEFEEIDRPTLVRGHEDGDVPASGRYWIDPRTGAVPRAELEFIAEQDQGRMEVELEFHRDVDGWVPVSWKESWTSGKRGSWAESRYDDFRRVTVSTHEIMK